MFWVIETVRDCRFCGLTPPFNRDRSIEKRVIARSKVHLKHTIGDGYPSESRSTAPLAPLAPCIFTPIDIRWDRRHPSSHRHSMGLMARPSNLDLLQGTLDLLVLKTLTWGPAHGYTVAYWIQQLTDDVLQVGEGSLYPALHRLEERGWVDSEWRRSENNRKAKFYQ